MLEINNEIFRSFAYATHPAAYIDAGLKYLPLNDLIELGISPDFKDLIRDEEINQVIDIMEYLFIEKGKLALSSPSNFFKLWLEAIYVSNPIYVAQLFAKLGIKAGTEASEALSDVWKDIWNGDVGFGMTGVSGVLTGMRK